MPAPVAYDQQYYGNDNSNVYSGQVFTPAPVPMDPVGKSGGYGAHPGASTDYDDEPPLLEGECKG